MLISPRLVCVEVAFDRDVFPQIAISEQLYCSRSPYTMFMESILINISQAWMSPSLPEGKFSEQSVPAGWSSQGHSDDMALLESLQAC